MTTTPIAAGPNDVTVMQHTPGPWKLHDGDSNAPYIVADQGEKWNNPVVCNLYDDNTPEDSVTIGAWLEPHANAIANGHLIAAAPDLLAALQEVVAISDRKHDAWDAAKAAINKALGRDA